MRKLLLFVAALFACPLAKAGTVPPQPTLYLQPTGTVQNPSNIAFPGTGTGAITVSSTTGWPVSGVFVADGEWIKYTVTDSTHVAMVQRGLCGTTPVSHTNGTSIIYLEGFGSCPASGIPHFAMSPTGVAVNGLFLGKGMYAYVDARMFATDGATVTTTALQNALNYASTNHIPAVRLGASQSALITSLSIPDYVTLDLGATPASKLSVIRDYRLSTGIQGVLALSSSGSITLGSASGLFNGTILRGDGTDPPTTFVASTTRDGLTVKAAEAGTAILQPNPSAVVQNVSILGFDTGVISSSASTKLLDVICDCRSGVLYSGAESDQAQRLQISSQLTKGLDLSSGLLYLADDGSGQYEITWDVSATAQFSFNNGDTFYVQPPTNGGQSAAGGWVISNAAVRANGVKGCNRAQGCPGGTLTGSVSGGTTLSATWTNTADPAGDYYLTVTPGTTGPLAVNQNVSSASCIAGGTKIKDIWDAQGRIYLTAQPSCSAGPQNVVFTDDAWSSGGTGFVDPSGRTGDGIEFLNSSGIKVDQSIIFAHDTELHFYDGSRNNHVTGCTTGEDDSSLDDGKIGILIDGTHAGNDADTTFIENCNAGQHAFKGIVINSDSAKRDYFTDVLASPGTAKTTGVSVEINSGAAQFNGLNTGGGRANVFVADGTTYRTVYPDVNNQGSGYIVGDVLTTTGGTCSQQAQFTVAGVTGTGGIKLSGAGGGSQTRAFICTVYPSNPISITGGTGTGAKLVTDGTITAAVSMVNLTNAMSDVYLGTPLGTAFTGVNNRCSVMVVCNHTATLDAGSLSINGTSLTPGLIATYATTSGAVAGHIITQRVTAGAGIQDSGIAIGTSGSAVPQLSGANTWGGQQTFSVAPVFSDQAGSRSNLGAAASGANGDITSLTGLLTPLPLTEGGTGAASASAARTSLGLGTAAVRSTGCSGTAVVPTFDCATPTWQGAPVWQGASGVLGTVAGVTGETLFFKQAAGQRERIEFDTGNSKRWTIDKALTAEGGLNSGSPLQVTAYQDDGVTFTTLLQANRASGPQGNGNAYLQAMAAGDYKTSRAASPTGNNAVGNYYQWDDLQPTSTLGSNPITPQNGTTSAKITWTAHLMDINTWVHVTGATAICSQTLSGYYPVTAVPDANTLTVDTGQVASCTTAGGGSAVQITPYFNTYGSREDVTLHNSGPNFTVGDVSYTVASPDYLVPLTSGISGPNYQGKFLAVLSPSDNSGLNLWSAIGLQANVVNRGNDEGPCDYSDCVRGTWVMSASATNLTQFSGNEGQNASAGYVAGHGGVANSVTHYFPRLYRGYLCASDSTVSDLQSPTGEGGVCFKSRGARDGLIGNPIATTNGSAVVTVTVVQSAGSLITAHNSPTVAYWPTAVTVNGTTCAAGAAIAISSLTNTTFQRTCTGNATSTGSGGGFGLWVAFPGDVPHAPMVFDGEFAHGITATDVKFDDGIALNMSGTIEGTAFNAGGTAGVSCSGSPTGSFASVNGIVTHC